jgi:quercetin dioxygenase-like cupin family protein
MEIIKRSNGAVAPTELRTATFTGVVYGDPLLDGTAGVAVTSVFFAPGGRTYWHSHAGGQVLHVVSGSGLIGVEGERPRPLGAGDVVWAPPGELHWHGGGQGSALLHLAVSLGTTSWGEPVSDADYGSGR